MSVALDSSVLIAALLAWHEHHAPALGALQRARARGEELVVPEDALVEAYAVLTRLPPPHRVSPGVAQQVLAASFEEAARLVCLRARDVWPLLRRLGEAGVAGGRTYDARILVAAQGASATRLLTLDARDYGRLDTGNVEIVVPP